MEPWPFGPILGDMQLSLRCCGVKDSDRTIEVRGEECSIGRRESCTVRHTRTRRSAASTASYSSMGVYCNMTIQVWPYTHSSARMSCLCLPPFVHTGHICTVKTLSGSHTKVPKRAAGRQESHQQSLVDTHLLIHTRWYTSKGGACITRWEGASEGGSESCSGTAEECRLDIWLWTASLGGGAPFPTAQPCGSQTATPNAAGSVKKASASSAVATTAELAATSSAANAPPLALPCRPTRACAVSASSASPSGVMRSMA